MKIELDTSDAAGWIKSRAQSLGLIGVPAACLFASHWCASEAVRTADGKINGLMDCFWGLAGLVFGIAFAITLGVGGTPLINLGTSPGATK